MLLFRLLSHLVDIDAHHFAFIIILMQPTSSPEHAIFQLLRYLQSRVDCVRRLQRHDDALVLAEVSAMKPPCR